MGAIARRSQAVRRAVIASIDSIVGFLTQFRAITQTIHEISPCDCRET
jgi:hypothetical protein